jgi:predicted deacylase
MWLRYSRARGDPGRSDMTTLESLRAVLRNYPIELTKPDICRWRASRTGIDYVHSFDSGLPGPHVMINALTHGNEMCGAIALDTLLRADLRPCRGRLTLSFANVLAYEKFDPTDPDATRYVDEDMNRLWAAEVLDGPRNSLELRRARALRPLIDTVDFLFDIHSMHEKSALDPDRATAERHCAGATNWGVGPPDD